jgi:LytS/YehU family sensor histidine kinase
MVHTYFIAYWLLPRTFFKGKYILAFAGIGVLLIVFSILELVISNEFVFKIFNPGKAFQSGYLNFGNVIISGIGNHYIILLFLAIQVGRSWYYAETRKTKLQQIKLETELEIYRYQLQPRLILTLVEEIEISTKKMPGKLPDLIVKVSAFLSRFLFEGKEELISMNLETRLISDFLDVHKFALGDRLVSNFHVNGKVQSYLVPPLLLLPFINSAIEMAYHCNNSFESTVLIKAEKKYLLFTFRFWSEENFRINNNENLENTKKRLKHQFPGKYRLKENIDENFMEYSLEIFY